MPRSLLICVALVVIACVVALILLSRVDATRASHRIVKVIPENALAH